MGLPGDMCTYRNNLNKIAGTLLSPKDPWIVDAYKRKDGLLCLDMHPLPQREYPNSDQMTYYGYK